MKSWSSWKKKEDIFCTVYFVQRNICVLSQCIMYWIHFQNIHTFTYQKALLHTLLLLVFKIVESLHCILKPNLIKQIKFDLHFYSQTPLFFIYSLMIKHLWLNKQSRSLTLKMQFKFDLFIQRKPSFILSQVFGISYRCHNLTYFITRSVSQRNRFVVTVVLYSSQNGITLYLKTWGFNIFWWEAEKRGVKTLLSSKKHGRYEVSSI